MANKVNVSFNDKHEGSLQVENFETKLSYRGDGLAPYELFLGGKLELINGFKTDEVPE